MWDVACHRRAELAAAAGTALEGPATAEAGRTGSQLGRDIRQDNHCAEEADSCTAAVAAGQCQ